MRVAIVHYWLVGMRGGEKVLEALCDLYPEAVIFTHVVARDKISEKLKSHEIRTSFIGSLPRPARYYKTYLPLMPMALEQLDLRGFDLIISSESGPAKGIIPPPDSLHLCYCHSPMRYIWNMFHDYRDQQGRIGRLLMSPAAHYLRMWDAISATRVDAFVANSENVRKRLLRYYGRDASVVPPPVDIDAFSIAPPSDIGEDYLMVGELIGYKRPDLAVSAFNRLGKPLTVIGGGELLPRLKQMAGPNVKVLGPQPFHVLQEQYARCKALIFPGEEDAGIVPLEAMASGRPVVAFGRGGATETVQDGVTGVFFHEQTESALADAVSRLEKLSVNSMQIRAVAERFSIDRFKAGFIDAVENEWAKKNMSSIRQAGWGKGFAKKIPSR